MTGVGLASSVAMIMVQKKVFGSANLFRSEFMGTPAYAHLTSAALHERIADFGTKCGVFSLAMAASVVVAVARRDARYLLGWLATFPWLLLNLTALQDVKSQLAVYSGFPCVCSTFWIFAYGRVRTRHAAGAGRCSRAPSRASPRPPACSGPFRQPA